MTTNKKMFNTADKLPEDRQYVLGFHNRTTWHDRDDQQHVNFVVVKFKKGLSIEDREKMKNNGIDNPIQIGYRFPSDLPHPIIDYTPRSNTYCSEDECGNNKKPYNWQPFGPGSFDGQEIEWWMPLPDILTIMTNKHKEIMATTIVTDNEMDLFKGIRQVQRWIEKGNLVGASNACTDLLIEYGRGIIYDAEIEELYKAKKA